MYSIQPGSDPKPPVDAELLKIMRDVYQRFTGYQVAEVIKVIRAEIIAEQEDCAERTYLILKLKGKEDDTKSS